MQQVAQDLANSSVPTLAFIAPGRTDIADMQLAQSSGLAAAPNTPNVDAFLRAVDGSACQEREQRAGAEPFRDPFYELVFPHAVSICDSR